MKKSIIKNKHTDSFNVFNESKKTLTEFIKSFDNLNNILEKKINSNSHFNGPKNDKSKNFMKREMTEDFQKLLSALENGAASFVPLNDLLNVYDQIDDYYKHLLEVLQTEENRNELSKEKKANKKDLNENKKDSNENKELILKKLRKMAAIKKALRKNMSSHFYRIVSSNSNNKILAKKFLSYFTIIEYNFIFSNYLSFRIQEMKIIENVKCNFQIMEEILKREIMMVKFWFGDDFFDIKENIMKINNNSLDEKKNIPENIISNFNELNKKKLINSFILFSYSLFKNKMINLANNEIQEYLEKKYSENECLSKNILSNILSEFQRIRMENDGILEL